MSHYTIPPSETCTAPTTLLTQTRRFWQVYSRPLYLPSVFRCKHHMQALTQSSFTGSSVGLRTRQAPRARALKNLCVAAERSEETSGGFKQNLFAKGTALVLGASLIASTPALADLNKYEAAAGGEFGIGTAQQYGEADLSGRDFSNQDLTRSNFTAADCRNCNFKNSKLVGAYFIKAVTFNANFENADLSDVLMDRAVLVEANLKNAVLQRVVFTRSDLKDAIIEGADFTNALVDRTQQISLCRYADGVNSVTGVSTRKSLGCGSRRRFREASPSSPEGPQVSEETKEGFKSTIPVYRE